MVNHQIWGTGISHGDLEKSEYCWQRLLSRFEKRLCKTWNPKHVKNPEVCTQLWSDDLNHSHPDIRIHPRFNQWTFEMGIKGTFPRRKKWTKWLSIPNILLREALFIPSWFRIQGFRQLLKAVTNGSIPWWICDLMMYDWLIAYWSHHSFPPLLSFRFFLPSRLLGLLFG